MAGRLSKEKKNAPIDPNKRLIADKWMQTIGMHYEQIKDACRINSLKQRKEWKEDVFEDSIVLCYDCICRNGLRDQTDDGCKNYLFNAYKTNLLHEKVIPYNSRKVDDEDFFKTYDEQDNEEGKKKFMEQLYTDFATVRVLEIAEKNVDQVSFYCYRLKYLMEKMSYRRLVKITNIKNAKARVKNVLSWIQENISEEELRQEFEDKYQNNLDF